MPPFKDDSGIVILQSQSGTAEARSRKLQQYCVDFAEMLMAFKILFGPFGPIEYQEVRRQAREQGYWPWGSDGLGQEWPTVQELEDLVGGQVPPVYTIESDFDTFIPPTCSAGQHT